MQPTAILMYRTRDEEPLLDKVYGIISTSLASVRISVKKPDARGLLTVAVAGGHRGRLTIFVPVRYLLEQLVWRSSRSSSKRQSVAIT